MYGWTLKDGDLSRQDREHLKKLVSDYEWNLCEDSVPDHECLCRIIYREDRTNTLRTAFATFVYSFGTVFIGASPWVRSQVLVNIYAWCEVVL